MQLLRNRIREELPTIGAGDASELIARGATVVGVDKSAGLLTIARERLGLDACRQGVRGEAGSFQTCAA